MDNAAKQAIEAVFQQRDDAERFCAEAKAAGKSAEEARWRSVVRRLDEKIAKFGWVRNT